MLTQKNTKSILEQINSELIVEEITKRIEKYGMTINDIIAIEITADAGCLYYKTTLSNRYSFSVIALIN